MLRYQQPPIVISRVFLCAHKKRASSNQLFDSFSGSRMDNTYSYLFLILIIAHTNTASKHKDEPLVPNTLSPRELVVFAAGDFAGGFAVQFVFIVKPAVPVPIPSHTGGIMGARIGAMLPRLKR